MGLIYYNRTNTSMQGARLISINRKSALVIFSKGLTDSLKWREGVPVIFLFKLQ